MSWGTAHLTDGAEYWERFADRLEFGFAEVHNLIRSSAWQGHAFDAAESRAASDKEKASRVGERLREAAKVSRQGASDLSAAQSRLRSAVEDAWDAGFNVYDDYMVKYAGSVKTVEEQAVRQAQAEGFAGDIRQRAAQLLGLDQRVGSEITTALGNLIGFRFGYHYTACNVSGGPGSGDKGTFSRCSNQAAMLWNSGAADDPGDPSAARCGLSIMMPTT